MKKSRKIFSILLVLVLAVQLTAIPAAMAATRTVSRTSSKVTTSYTERKLKLSKKASKTYSVVGKPVTCVTYNTQGNASIKTTPTMNYKKNSANRNKWLKTHISNNNHYDITNLDILFPLSVDAPAAPRNLKKSTMKKKVNTQNIIKPMYAIVQMNSLLSPFVFGHLLGSIIVNHIIKNAMFLFSDIFFAFLIYLSY